MISKQEGNLNSKVFLQKDEPSIASGVSINSMNSLTSINSIGDLSICNLNPNNNGKNKDNRIFETAE